jgi:formylglycine-generating enzyme required for sulfatase activity
MSDVSAPRKSGPWPLLAISLLVLLLGAFLGLKFLKGSDERPLVVKEPQRPAEPAKTAEPETPTSPAPPETPPTPPVPPEASPEKERATAVERALQARKWDEADKLLQGAPESAEIAALRARLAAGRREEDSARLEAVAREEAKRKRDQEWVVVREKVEKAKEALRWDEASGLFETLLKEHPDLGKAEEVVDARRSLERLRGESDVLFKKEMAEAEKQFAAGRFAQAETAAQKALRFYPERKELATACLEKIRAAKLESQMLRVPDALCWIGHETNEDEKPLRQVKLKAFYIDRYEVTNEDYQVFVQATGHPAPPHWGSKTVPRGGERHPVVFVSFADAEAYAQWAGKRLPTAEEWEVAARGPDRREWPWGNAFSEKENVFVCNSMEYWQVVKGAPSTTPVDHPAFANGESAFRVHGMGGNVWEWTASAAGDGEKFRVLKGGSFMTSSKALRCANRLLEDPRLIHPDVGFRCARDAK